MLLKAGVLSLVLLLASRLLGLARESAQAAAFGTSGLGDVAVLMLTLPDWLTGLLASGALAYVLLPYWAQQPPAHHAATQRKVAVGLLAGGVLLALLLWLGQSQAIALLASGLPADLRPAAAGALAWSAIAIPPALLAALWVTRLQHERDFVGMYAANLAVNVVLIGALVLVALRRDPATALAYLGFFLVAAMLLRLAWLGWRQHSQEPVAPAAGPPAALPHAAIWLWAALSSGLPLALPFVARSIASQAGEGELATFNYAWKLVELPLILAIQLVASLAFPAITRAFAGDGDPGATVRQAFALAWALACAAAAALLVGAPAMAQLLFGWGRMTPDSVARIASWGATGAWGLLPQALIAVSLTVLATGNRMRPAAWAYALALGALLLAGEWTLGDGTRLMIVLNVLLSGVALASVMALGRDARAWLPWRGMALPSLLLAGVGGLRASGVLVSSAWGLAPGLAAAALAAVAVLAAAWLASDDMRRALRR